MKRAGGSAAAACWPGCCADHAGAVGFPGRFVSGGTGGGGAPRDAVRPVPGPAGAVAAAGGRRLAGFWLLDYRMRDAVFIRDPPGRRAGAPVPRGCLCRRGGGIFCNVKPHCAENFPDSGGWMRLFVAPAHNAASKGWNFG